MTTQTIDASATAQASNASDAEILLEVKNLKMYFPVTSGIFFQRKIADVKAVDDVSFFIRRGETLGLVGESGCGKTTTGRCILQLYKPTEGDIIFEGEDLNALEGRAMREMRRKVQVIFQDPYGSLNPRMTCGDIVGEPLIVHKLTSSKQEYRDRVTELLQTVGTEPLYGGPLPARVQRRSAPAHRHSARAWRSTPASSSATSLCPRSTCPFRRRSSTCSKTCKTSSG